jgi:hypothetical protein
MQIFIPSRNRGYRQETFKNLPHSLREKTIILLDEDDDHERYRGYPTQVLPDYVRGIGGVRQWIIDNAKDKVVMLDDDLRFASRRYDDPTKFTPATDADITKAFMDLDRILDRYAHASLSTREGGNRNTNDYIWNTRLLRVLAYRADILRKENIRFDQIPVMEDFDVTLNLLRRGYPNIAVNYLVQDQLGSNLAGGCSEYRTLAVQASAAHMLEARHPQFVTVVTKKTKTAWGGQERTDVRISWKQALRSTGNTPLLDRGAVQDLLEEGSGEAEALE